MKTFSFSSFFIRLQFNKHGILREEGFLTPNKYDPEAISLWLPLSKNVVGLDLDTAKYILANIGDHFCQLVISEKEVMSTIEPHSKINLCWSHLCFHSFMWSSKLLCGSCVYLEIPYKTWVSLFSESHCELLSTALCPSQGGGKGRVIPPFFVSSCFSIYQISFPITKC